MPFDFAPLLRTDLPAPAEAWDGFPEFNFVGGHNDADSIPAAELSAGVARALARDGRNLATYKLQSGPLGYLPLRECIAALLVERAAMPCDPEQVLVTSGSLQAIDLVNSVFLEPGDTVIVEAATYAGALGRLGRCGARWIGVGGDEQGLRTDELANVLARLAARGERAKYIYTIPSVQNPTGTVMSRERRLELLRVAARYDVAVFEDDCYADLLWEGERPPAIRALDEDGRVFYCGTFSKTIAPALRVGYLVADWPLLSRLVAMKGDGGGGALEQMALAEFLPEHFAAHVDALRDTLAAKARAMVEALDEHFGAAAEYRVPRGGIYIWVTLPEAVDTSRLAAAALEEGIAVNPGAQWSADPEDGRRRLRLCFGHPSVETIRDGVARLAAVCHREFAVPARSANVVRSA